jgi:GAF domain-containing protein
MVIGDILAPRLALGENMRQLSSSRVRVGEGLVGWVAETGNAMLNGNPSVDLGAVRNEPKTTLRAALALPLRNNGRILGVLALYRLDLGSFTAEHLSVLELACAQFGLAICECPEQRQPRGLSHTSSMPENRVSGDSSWSEISSMMFD